MHFQSLCHLDRLSEAKERRDPVATLFWIARLRALHYARDDAKRQFSMTKSLQMLSSK